MKMMTKQETETFSCPQAGFGTPLNLHVRGESLF